MFRKETQIDTMFYSLIIYTVLTFDVWEPQWAHFQGMLFHVP